jgi:type II secretory pathway pseudopilin PulG
MRRRERRAGAAERKKSTCAGITLLELMVALALSTLIVGMVFSVWRFVEKHTAMQRNKTLFGVEADRISRGVMSELRRTPFVLEWDRNGIAFVSENKGDTVVYRFDGYGLRRNDAEISPKRPGMTVSGFSVETSEAVESAGGGTALLELTFAYEDQSGNCSSMTYAVNVRCAQESNVIGSGIGKGWNFEDDF